MRVTTLSGMKAVKLSVCQKVLESKAIYTPRLILLMPSPVITCLITVDDLPEAVDSAVYSRTRCFRSVQEEVFLCLCCALAILDDDVFLSGT